MKSKTNLRIHINLMAWLVIVYISIKPIVFTIFHKFKFNFQSISIFLNILFNQYQKCSIKSNTSYTKYVLHKICYFIKKLWNFCPLKASFSLKTIKFDLISSVKNSDWSSLPPEIPRHHLLKLSLKTVIFSTKNLHCFKTTFKSNA